MIKKISKYLFFSLLLHSLITQSLLAQEYRIKGPRIGFDFSGLLLKAIRPYKTFYSASLDYEMFRDIYPVIEFGYNKINLQKENYDYFSEGNYFMAGAEFNLYNSYKENEYHMFYGGFRLAFSNYSHQSNEIRLLSDYWGNTSFHVPKTSLSAQWFEIITGVRAEIFKNVYMGWNFRLKFILFSKNPSEINPYNIVGYGDSEKRTNLGFSYSLMYKIPIIKIPVKEIKKK